MFTAMFLSNVKYQDPTKVLESIVDDNGDSISIYEQKDIGEFFLNFLDRMQDGLGENKNLIRKLMGDDFALQMKLNQRRDCCPSQKGSEDDNLLDDVKKKKDAQFAKQNSVGEDAFADEQEDLKSDGGDMKFSTGINGSILETD